MAKKKPTSTKAGPKAGPKKTSTERVRERLLEKEKQGPKARAEADVPVESSEWPEEGKVTNRTSGPVKTKPGRKEKQEKFSKTYGQKYELMYPEFQVFVYQDTKDFEPDLTKVKPGQSCGILDSNAAMELLGWTEEDEQLGLKFGNDFKFRDYTGKKIRLLMNPSNRPFRIGFAKRYALEILRKKWAFNGESIILDRHGRILSGQHRLAAVIFAQQMLTEDIEKWKPYGWDKRGVFIECIVCAGISEKPEVADTIDLAQKRTLGDVFYRNDEFSGRSEKQGAKATNILSHAVRLVWLRSGNQKISHAPHFPHSEALDFLSEHPEIRTAVEQIVEFNGSGKEGKRIDGYVSLGTAAGMFYLMATSKTDAAAYNAGEEELNLDNWDKAVDFWQIFATQGDKLPAGHVIRELRKRLSEMSAGDSAGRDEIIGTIAKAFNLWMDGKKTVGPLKLKRVVDEETDQVTLAEDPRVGGLDSDISAE